MPRATFAAGAGLTRKSSLNGKQGTSFAGLRPGLGRAGVTKAVNLVGLGGGLNPKTVYYMNQVGGIGRNHSRKCGGPPCRVMRYSSPTPKPTHPTPAPPAPPTPKPTQDLYDIDNNGLIESHEKNDVNILASKIHEYIVNKKLTEYIDLEDAKYAASELLKYAYKNNQSSFCLIADSIRGRIHTVNHMHDECHCDTKCMTASSRAVNNIHDESIYHPDGEFYQDSCKPHELNLLNRLFTLSFWTYGFTAFDFDNNGYIDDEETAAFNDLADMLHARYGIALSEAKILARDALNISTEVLCFAQHPTTKNVHHIKYEDEKCGCEHSCNTGNRAFEDHKGEILTVDNYVLDTNSCLTYPIQLKKDTITIHLWSFILRDLEDLEDLYDINNNGLVESDEQRDVETLAFDIYDYIIKRKLTEYIDLEDAKYAASELLKYAYKNNQSSFCLIADIIRGYVHPVNHMHDECHCDTKCMTASSRAVNNIHDESIYHPDGEFYQDSCKPHELNLLNRLFTLSFWTYGFTALDLDNNGHIDDEETTVFNNLAEMLHTRYGISLSEAKILARDALNISTEVLCFAQHPTTKNVHHIKYEDQKCGCEHSCNTGNRAFEDYKGVSLSVDNYILNTKGCLTYPIQFKEDTITVHLWDFILDIVDEETTVLNDLAKVLHEKYSISLTDAKLLIDDALTISTTDLCFLKHPLTHTVHHINYEKQQCHCEHECNNKDRIFDDHFGSELSIDDYELDTNNCTIHSAQYKGNTLQLHLWNLIHIAEHEDKHEISELEQLANANNLDIIQMLAKELAKKLIIPIHYSSNIIQLLESDYITKLQDILKHDIENNLCYNNKIYNLNNFSTSLLDYNILDVNISKEYHEIPLSFKHNNYDVLIHLHISSMIGQETLKLVANKINTCFMPSLIKNIDNHIQKTNNSTKQYMYPINCEITKSDVCRIVNSDIIHLNQKVVEYNSDNILCQGTNSCCNQYNIQGVINNTDDINDTHYCMENNDTIKIILYKFNTAASPKLVLASCSENPEIKGCTFMYAVKHNTKYVLTQLLGGMQSTGWSNNKIDKLVNHILLNNKANLHKARDDNLLVEFNLNTMSFTYTHENDSICSKLENCKTPSAISNSKTTIDSLTNFLNLSNERGLLYDYNSLCVTDNLTNHKMTVYALYNNNIPEHSTLITSNHNYDELHIYAMKAKSEEVFSNFLHYYIDPNTTVNTEADLVLGNLIPIIHN